ncbi:UvrD-helicase domain-containing protein [Pelotomaculum terephthalicicum JT]|uniref:UvrD-helicase domain-containing protein n=1 Tax=Pelotomaculum terephthalicicum TaxID=206393 RepID=UPI001F03955A|nr:UvrD-helicase domain-containing protein [Pelotomaculum terephthalicicum]MCG9969896.1 UvrD-helicase domain-containing protein [Pelotomaculum terephthalicicum JT]
MAGKVNNCFLVNAPAGSGKTTQIKAMIRQFIIDNPKDNILCITYTKRAADELSKDIHTPNVFIGTIHSFLHAFMKRYFAHKDVLNLYYKMFEDAIKKRISNPEADEHIAASNEKYKEKYGDLSYEIIQKNIKIIAYNESSFSSLYYGGLSHDDLIIFSKLIVDTFPVIRKRISSKYQYIFIDEYQDTTADVLNIFYDSVAETKSQLYLFGDKMQQIYKNYDGSFEDRFALFDTSRVLNINYRSVPEIVNLLNKIYNDTKYDQDSSEKMKQVQPTIHPQVIICDNIEDELLRIKENDPDTLVLYLLNKERFAAIGSLNLYQAFDSMDKYAFGRAYSPVDVLTSDYDENPDPLIKLLYLIVDIYYNYENRLYGLIIQKLRNHTALVNKDGWYITSHSGKQKLHDNLNVIFSVLINKEKTIADLLTALKTTSIIQPSYLEGILEDEEYRSVLDVPTNEILAMVNYLNQPKISTQHGVKGESHNSVVFVADDSTRNPVVHMYRFFEMWGQLDISLSSFQQFYYSYTKELYNLQISIGSKINDLVKESYMTNEKSIIERAVLIRQRFGKDPIFSFLCAENYERFLAKPGVTKAKDCFKENTVYGVLSAYKLFYVGCSRARKNLIILIDRSKLKGDIELQKRKFATLGFVVS